MVLTSSFEEKEPTTTAVPLSSLTKPRLPLPGTLGTAPSGDFTNSFSVTEPSAPASAPPPPASPAPTFSPEMQLFSPAVQPRTGAFMPVDVGESYTPPPPVPPPTAPPPPTGFFPVDDGQSPPATITPPQIAPGGGTSQATTTLPHPISNPIGETPVSLPGLPPATMPGDPVSRLSPERMAILQDLYSRESKIGDEAAAADAAFQDAYTGDSTDPRFRMINPSTSPRLASLQSLLDSSVSSLAGSDRAGMTTAAQDRYRSMFGSGSVPFSPTGTSVAGRSIDPTIGFQDYATRVGAGSIDPNVGFTGVGTNVGERSLDPRVAGRSVNTQVGAGSSVMPGESDRFRALSGQQDAAVDALSTGPDRTALAQATFDDLIRRSAEDRMLGTQAIGRDAARLGRIGAGLTGTNLVDMETEIQRRLGESARGLARDVSEGDIADRFNRVNTLAGLRGEEFGMGQATRGEERLERDYTTGLGERNVARALDDRDYHTGLDERNVGRAFEDRAFGTGLAERNLARAADERDTALGLAERNVGRQFDDRSFTTGLEERNLARGADRASSLQSLLERNQARDVGERDYATGLDERNLARAADERDTALGLAERNVDRDFDRARTAADFGLSEADAQMADRRALISQLAGLEGQVSGEEAALRGEERGEREFQHQLGREGIQDAVQRRVLEESLLDSEFRRATEMARLGFAGDPSGIQFDAGESYGGDAADTFGGLADYLARLEYERRRRAGEAVPPPTGTPVDDYVYS